MKQDSASKDTDLLALIDTISQRRRLAPKAGADQCATDDITPQTKRIRRVNDITDAGAAIATAAPVGDEMVFCHSALCQVGLPRSKVDGREFMRRSGNAWLNVQAGYLDEGAGPILQPVPYGPTPRLAMLWVSTYARRHSTREIYIGKNPSQFLQMLGMDTQGYRYKKLREQMHALAACRLQIGYLGRTYNGQPIEQFDAWISRRGADVAPLWPGTLVLSQSFYDELMEFGVPLDGRAIQQLSGSSIALDIYAWLAHRLHRIDGRPILLHWKSLRQQFGHEYHGPNAHVNFRDPFLNGLRLSLAVYPKANVKVVHGGLRLSASPPPVPFKGAA